MRFLVESTFAKAPTDDILALIPAETARGKELDAQGIREALYLAVDQSKSWQVFRSESPQTLQTTLESFPLHPFLTFTITPLAEAEPISDEVAGAS